MDGTGVRRAARVVLVLLLAGGLAGGASAPRARGERGVLAALERDLAAPRPEKRRRAVRTLAERAAAEASVRTSQAAWRLVIGALADPDPQVADEAQLRLAELRDERLRRALGGREGLRARDELVRLRVAEAFGRMEDVDGSALVRALDRRRPELARTLLWSLERGAARDALRGDPAELADAAAELVDGRGDGALRGAALVALVELEALASVGAGQAGRAERLARHALGDREPEVRAAALLALQRVGADRGFAAATALSGDTSAAVRAQAIETLAATERRAALGRLVERLEAEPRERLVRRVVARLRDLSGMRYGRDPRSWTHWLARLPAGWTPATRAPRAGPDPREGGGRSQASTELPVLSDRLAFLIDFSGSLWQGRVGDRTRRDVAVEDLAQALERLPPTARFNLIPYTDRPLPFAERLVDPDRRNVARALDYLRNLNASGKGNVYDAILLALEDPELDTIVLYTDGSPTGGSRWNLDLMVELLLERTRTRRVAFDAVLIDPPGGNRRRWERLAEATGGRVVVR